jgi:hypothetical protein
VESIHDQLDMQGPFNQNLQGPLSIAERPVGLLDARITALHLLTQTRLFSGRGGAGESAADGRQVRNRLSAAWSVCRKPSCGFRPRWPNPCPAIDRKTGDIFIFRLSAPIRGSRSWWLFVEYVSESYPMPARPLRCQVVVGLVPAGPR